MLILTFSFSDSKRQNKTFWTDSQQAFHEFNLLKPTGHVMHQQFNIQQL